MTCLFFQKIAFLKKFNIKKSIIAFSSLKIKIDLIVSLDLVTWAMYEEKKRNFKSSMGMFGWVGKANDTF